MSFPYLARTTLRYKSPHATDLSFAKDETIRVTGPSPDDEDWLIGELLDGSKSGGFPKDFITPIEEAETAPPAAAATAEPAAAPAPAEPPSAPAPPSPKPAPVELPPSPAPAPAPALPPPAAAPSSPPRSTAPQPASATSDSPPAPKSMKDRLAFFAAAQTKAAPPPPIKPKPAGSGGLTWSQRQKLRQEQEAKEREAGGGSAPPATATEVAKPPAEVPVQHRSPGVEKTEGEGGMSAADAMSSISKGGSLRERMAALQGAGAFGKKDEDESAPPKLKPSGKVWSRPPAPPAPEEAAEDDTAEATQDAKSAAKSPGVAEEGDPLAAEGGEVEGGEEQEEETEEEKEKARRAAIAARMAKLGARGPMGMAAPPKPARKPTREVAALAESPSVEKPEPTVAPVSLAAANAPPQAVLDPDTTKEDKPQAEIAPPLATSPPTSVPMPAMPRRTAPPRRRPAAQTSASATSASAEEKRAPHDADLRFEREGPDGTEPPPQVMVDDEEKPLPKTEEGLRLEKEKEEVGRGTKGYEGAQMAGIATLPVEPEGQAEEENESAAEAKEDAMRSPKLDPVGMVPLHPPAEDGTALDDDEAEASPPPLPPHRRGSMGLVVGMDEIEMKHEHEGRHSVLSADELVEGDQGDRESQEDEVTEPAESREEGEEEEKEIAAAPAPPPRRMSERPAGPRPLPPAPASASPERSSLTGTGRSLPPPPTRVAPPVDDEAEEDEEDEEEQGHEGDLAAADQDEQEEQGEVEDEEPAPAPPPRRQPTLPPPIQVGIPTPAGPPRSPSIKTSPASPRVAQAPSPVSPAQPKNVPPPPPSDEPAETKTEEDEDKARRSGIAARMAKLGGIKFGMPPPVPSFKKQSREVAQSPSGEEGPKSPGVEETEDVASPGEERTSQEAFTSPISPPAAVAGQGDDDESPEAEASRRRATLARLRAGGALGFGGMFNHGAMSPTAEDERGLQNEAPEEVAAPSPVPAGRPLASATGRSEPDDTQTPPPPPPSTRPSRPAPVQTGEEEDEDAPPPPPPPGRPGHDRTASIDKPTMPASPIRSPSGRRPPIPSTEKRMSHQSRPLPIPVPEDDVAQGPLMDEPAVMMMQGSADEEDDDEVPPPPPPAHPPRGLSMGQPLAINTATSPPPPPPPAVAQSPISPRRSMSIQSRMSAGSVPPSPAATRKESMDMTPPPRTSMAGGARPGYDQLVQASREAGGRLLRSARGLMGQRSSLGDGSPAGFVLAAMQHAGLPSPQGAWGQVVFEQEAASVLKRYDEPRPGDIAAFHDAKLKGKKGLTSYSQSVGSVEEPLVGVVGEFESKGKHKLRVLQVERGAAEEVSYRCDDLKSGRIVVYRPGF